MTNDLRVSAKLTRTIKTALEHVGATKKAYNSVKRQMHDDACTSLLHASDGNVQVVNAMDNWLTISYSKSFHNWLTGMTAYTYVDKDGTEKVNSWLKYDSKKESFYVTKSEHGLRARQEFSTAWKGKKTVMVKPFYADNDDGKADKPFDLIATLQRARQQVDKHDDKPVAGDNIPAWAIAAIDDILKKANEVAASQLQAA